MAKFGSDLFTLNNCGYFVDYYSDYYELEKLSSFKAANVIKAMKSYFSHYEIPEQLISDNRPQCILAEFKLFEREWDLKHKLVHTTVK